MRIGAKYRVRPVFANEATGRIMTGTLVWIHPAGRFGVLEFEGINGKCRESFWPYELTMEVKK